MGRSIDAGHIPRQEKNGICPACNLSPVVPVSPMQQGVDMRRAAILFVFSAVSACATHPEDPGLETVFGRVDCRPIANDAALQQDFEQARTICVNRAQADAVAGTAAMPVGRGIGGAIGSGIAAGVAQSQIQNATTMSCMAEHGYLYRTRYEHQATCQAIAAQQVAQQPPPASKRSTKR